MGDPDVPESVGPCKSCKKKNLGFATEAML